MKEKYFLSISFVLSWGIELILIATGHTQDAVFTYTYPLIVLAPAFAVLVTKYAIKEPLWMNFWLKPEGRRTLKYALIGWLAPVLLVAVGAGLYFLVFNENFDASMSAEIAVLRKENNGLTELTNRDIRSTLIYQIVVYIVMAPILNFFTCVGEEVSWRGYFLNMLCEKYPKWRAVITDGLVWGLWYFPLVIGMNLFYGNDYPGYPFVGCLCTLVYCTVQGTCYSYLTIKTHSCIPAILANACLGSINGVGTIFMKDTENISVFLNPMPTSVLGGFGFIAAAGILLYLFAKGKIEPAPVKTEVVSNKNTPTGSLKNWKQNKYLKRDR